MVDFLQSNSSLIITLLITLSASIIPIPFVVEKLVKNFNRTNEINDFEAKSIAEMADRINEKDIDGERKHTPKHSSKKNTSKTRFGSSPQIMRISSQNAPKKYDFTDHLHDIPKEYEYDESCDNELNDNFDAEASKESTTHSKQLSPKYSSAKIVSLYELYEKRNIDKFLKKVSFILAVIMSIIGTIIIFTGIIISLFSTKEIGWITTSSGAIIEIVASIYFWLLNKTMKEVKYNSKQLEKTEDLITAIELVERISNSEIKDTAYKDMIDKLLSYDK